MQYCRNFRMLWHKFVVEWEHRGYLVAFSFTRKADAC